MLTVTYKSGGSANLKLALRYEGQRLQGAWDEAVDCLEAAIFNSGVRLKPASELEMLSKIIILDQTKSQKESGQ